MDYRTAWQAQHDRLAVELTISAVSLRLRCSVGWLKIEWKMDDFIRLDILTLME